MIRKSILALTLVGSISATVFASPSASADAEVYAAVDPAEQASSSPEDNPEDESALLKSSLVPLELPAKSAPTRGPSDNPLPAAGIA